MLKMENREPHMRFLFDIFALEENGKERTTHANLYRIFQLKKMEKKEPHMRISVVFFN